jgi:glycosyltransferase involved in cell wall biosynthesis
MKQSEVIVVHEFNGKKYLEALIKLHDDGKIKSLRFVESSVLKKFTRDVLIERTSVFIAFKRALQNAVFRFQVPFIREKTVIVCMPPWDFRMIWYGLLTHNNQFIYNTSWPYWELHAVPRRYGFLSKLFRAAWNKVLKTPGVQIVSVSSASAEEVRQRYPETSVSTISHVVSDAFFEAEPPTNSQEFGILYVGELSEKKGIKLIPQIIDQLSDLSVRMSFVGDGSLRNFVDELSDRPNITVHGKVADRKALAQIYSQHQVLLVPSLKTKKWEELFGMVLIEAMAIGLPVVVSDHIGPRSLVKHGYNGFLVPEGAVSSYAEHIRLLAEAPDKWREMSTNARNSALSYTLNSVAIQWFELLR